MILQNKSILLISPEPWDHIFVSKHHYATHLAASGNKVFFLNPPSKEEKVIRTDFENVWSVTYTGFPRGMRFYPSILQRLLTRSKYNKLQKLCNIQFDIVWSFDNSVFYNFEALPKEVFCISHIVDLNQNFQTAKAAKSADLCLGVIPQLVERLKKFNAKTHLVTHGVQDFPDNIETIELPGRNDIKALYAGNMMMPHIDWQCLSSIAKKNPHVDFIFIGPNWEVNRNSHKIELERLKNTHTLAAVSALMLPSYLKSASVLLLAYTSEYSLNYASPHKMMEYLASGTPIISSFLKDYDEHSESGLILTAKTEHDFNQHLASFTSNLGARTSRKNSEQRIQFCIENSYFNKIKEIEYLI